MVFVYVDVLFFNSFLCPPTNMWVGIKICTSAYVRLSICTSRNLVCATPPTPLYGLCSYPHTVTNMTKMTIKIWFCDVASFKWVMGLCHFFTILHIEEKWVFVMGGHPCPTDTFLVSTCVKGLITVQPNTQTSFLMKSACMWFNKSRSPLAQ